MRTPPARSVSTSSLASFASFAVLAAALSGCGNDAGFRPGDGGVAPGADAALPADDLAVALRQPTPIPLLPLRGTVIPSPDLVTITFSDHPFRDQVEKLGDVMMTSSWLATVGADYGVGHGRHAARLRLPDKAPSPTSEAQAIALIKRYAAMGMVPAPPPKADGTMVYLLYYPAKVDYTVDGEALCQDFEGYHSYLEFPDGGRAAFAIIGDCEFGLDDITNTASHELIEAASDPWLDSWMVSAKIPDAWAIEDGMENADLCWSLPSVREGGFALARSFSASAARNFREPCLPAPPNATSFETVVVSPEPAQKGAPGQQLSYLVTGWSTDPTMAPWDVVLAESDGGSFYLDDLGAKLAVKKLGHGMTARLTLTVPADASPGDFGGLLVLSGTQLHAAPVTFSVE